MKTLRAQLTARKPSTRPPRVRKAPPCVLSEDERDNRSRRCSRCGQRVLVPCYSCWLERHAARGFRYDPHDTHPTQDRPGCLPTVWSDEFAAKVWDAVVAGHDKYQIAIECDMTVSMAARTAAGITRYLKSFE